MLQLKKLIKAATANFAEIFFSFEFDVETFVFVFSFNNQKFFSAKKERKSSCLSNKFSAPAKNVKEKF